MTKCLSRVIDFQKQLFMLFVPVPGEFMVREKAPDGDYVPGKSRLDQIVARGVLRVGYLEDSLPNVFVNSESQLVGLDVGLANVLARDMGVDLEFVKESFESMVADLNAGLCDLIRYPIFS